MSVEKRKNPNIYPSPESMALEPIAILPTRQRGVLCRTQALIIQAILSSPDRTTFSSKELYEAIWPGQPYKLDTITQTMKYLAPHFVDLGGTITTRPSRASYPSIYDVYLPEAVRENIQIKMRRVPIGVTFNLPHGKVATRGEAVILHELIKDHLTPSSTILTNELWKQVYGDMPYSEPGMSGLLRHVQQDLKGTGMIVEKRFNYKITDQGRFVRSYSSLFLNLSGFIDKLTAETARITEGRIPTFTDEDVLAFVDLYSVFGAEKILRAHQVNFTVDTPSTLFIARAKVTKRYENKRERMPDPKEIIPKLIEKLLNLAAEDKWEIKGSPEAQKIFSIFEGLGRQRMKACLDKLYEEYTTYKH